MEKILRIHKVILLVLISVILILLIGRFTRSTNLYISREFRGGMKDEAYLFLTGLESGLELTAYVDKRAVDISIVKRNLNFLSAVNHKITSQVIRADINPGVFTEKNIILITYKDRTFSSLNLMSLQGLIYDIERTVNRTNLPVYVNDRGCRFSVNEFNKLSFLSSFKHFLKGYGFTMISPGRFRMEDPDKDQILLVPGLMDDITSEELIDYERFVNSGGNLFIFLEPESDIEEWENIQQLFKKFNLKPGKERLKESIIWARILPGPLTPVKTGVNSIPLYEPVPVNINRFIYRDQETRPILQVPGPNGPITVGMVTTVEVDGDNKNRGALVLIGDSDFLKSGSERNINAWQYLVGMFHLINSEKSEYNHINIIPGQLKGNKLRRFYLIFLLLPLLLFLIGLWGRRDKLIIHNEDIQ